MTDCNEKGDCKLDGHRAEGVEEEGEEADAATAKGDGQEHGHLGSGPLLSTSPHSSCS